MAHCVHDKFHTFHKILADLLRNINHHLRSLLHIRNIKHGNQRDTQNLSNKICFLRLTLNLFFPF